MDDPNIINLVTSPNVIAIIAVIMLISKNVRLFFSTLIPAEIRREHYKKELIKALIASNSFDLTKTPDDGIKSLSYVAEKLAEKAFDTEE